MNWGHKITIVIILFVIGMLGMVALASMQDVNMLDENYYDKELAYQNQIDATNRLSEEQQKQIFLVQEKSVSIFLPQDLASIGDSISLNFICYNKPSQDKKVMVKLASMPINIIEFGQGQYKARVSWQHLGIKYYYEKNLSI
jgi:hypothetical protein